MGAEQGGDAAAQRRVIRTRLVQKGGLRRGRRLFEGGEEQLLFAIGSGHVCLRDGIHSAMRRFAPKWLTKMKKT